METKFKETEIGRIPEEWELHQAKRVAFVNMGQSPNSSDCNDEGIGVPFLQGNADFGDKYPKISSWTTNSIKIAKLNDILMSVRAPVGDINLADTECCIGRGLCAITPKSGADLLFLYYILKSSMPRLLRFQQGSTFLAINKQNVDSHLIPLPSLPEQRKIAGILSAVDETIEKTDAIVQETQQLKKGLMQKLFTEGIGHTQFKETKIGRIPEEWECLGVEQVVQKSRNSIKAGPFGSTLTKSMYVESGYKVYGQEQVIPNDFTVGDYYISSEKFEELKAFEVKPNDLLISLVGTFGKISVAPDNIKRGIINPRLIKITPNTEKVTPQFLVFLMSSNIVQKQMQRFTHGATMGILNTKIIKSLILPIPPISEQHNIVRVLSEVDTEIEIEQSYKSELEQLKKGLMQVLLTGKVRVKV